LWALRSTEGSNPSPSALRTLDFMDVSFEYAGNRFTVPDRQATILAEKLRLFAKGAFAQDEERLGRLGAGETWREGALPAADLIEDALVGRAEQPLVPEEQTAEAIYWVLRLTELEHDPHGASGLRDALAAAPAR
jgi:hypothetical protein